ncbi:MAG: DUF1207 domain-containing protein [Elusimicrobia bacterium]|nr:DUF1207 domain-containing protein [Elusimicrobiota bacterium]
MNGGVGIAGSRLAELLAPYFLSFLFFLPELSCAGTLWFPKGGELFGKLIADPEEVQTSGQYFRLDGRNTVDFSVGNSWGIRRWILGEDKDWRVQWDISGVVQPRFLVSFNINEMEAVDFILNFPLEIRRGPFSSRVTLAHESAHLGDNFIARTGRERIAFSREFLQALAAWEFSYVFRAYGGAATLLHTIPNLPRTELQGGLEFRTPDFKIFLDHDCWLYLAQDFQSKEQNSWNLDSNTQLGMRIGFPSVARDLRIFLNFFRGHSVFGQFFRERESNFGAGLGFDF